jgi:hypothetical protein
MSFIDSTNNGLELIKTNNDQPPQVDPSGNKPPQVDPSGNKPPQVDPSGNKPPPVNPSRNKDSTLSHIPPVYLLLGVLFVIALVALGSMGLYKLLSRKNNTSNSQ